METYITPWWIGGNLLLMTNMIRFLSECNGDHMLKEMKKFDVLVMKMITDCKKNSIGEAYITPLMN